MECARGPSWRQQPRMLSGKAERKSGRRNDAPLSRDCSLAVSVNLTFLRTLPVLSRTMQLGAAAPDRSGGQQRADNEALYQPVVTAMTVRGTASSKRRKLRAHRSPKMTNEGKYRSKYRARCGLSLSRPATATFSRARLRPAVFSTQSEIS